MFIECADGTLLNSEYVTKIYIEKYTKSGEDRYYLMALFEHTAHIIIQENLTYAWVIKERDKLKSKLNIINCDIRTLAEVAYER